MWSCPDNFYSTLHKLDVKGNICLSVGVYHLHNATRKKGQYWIGDIYRSCIKIKWRGKKFVQNEKVCWIWCSHGGDYDCFWDATPCTPVEFRRLFARTYCLHLHGWRVSQVLSEQEWRGFTTYDGNSMFLQNVRELPPDYTALHPDSLFEGLLLAAP